MSEDYYKILGVAQTASPDELKRAYRNLAKRHHPDQNPDDAQAETRFKEISKAYSVLSDEQQRAAYDRYGHQAFEAGMNQGGGAGAGSSGGAGFGDFSSSMSDIFGDLFGDSRGGQARGHSNENQGESLRYDLEVTLEEVAKGANKEFTYPTEQGCTACSSSGAAPNSKIETCKPCGGAGVIQQRSGFFAFQRTCGACGGEGQVMTKPCPTCSGQGRLRTKKSLRVKIPKGINDGSQMRLSNKGNAGFRNGPSGDLFLFIHIKPHKIFQCDDRDLYCKVPISIVDACLGGIAQVPLLDGSSLDVKVPEGSQFNKRLRLRNKGLPQLHDRGQGDLFIDLQVEVPTNLNEAQKTLLKKLGDSLTENNAPTQQGFLDKIQSFFERFK